jgi:hypothetical protein
MYRAQFLTTLLAGIAFLKIKALATWGRPRLVAATPPRSVADAPGGASAAAKV